MVSNKKLGNDFESEFCDILFRQGFWVHNMAQTAAGQPADIIAVKSHIAYLIDCKVCSDNRFPLSRIEENQHLSMDLWKMCGNGEGWFALKTDAGIFMLHHDIMKALAYQQPILNIDDIRRNGMNLRWWLDVH